MNEDNFEEHYREDPHPDHEDRRGGERQHHGHRGHHGRHPIPPFIALGMVGPAGFGGPGGQFGPGGPFGPMRGRGRGRGGRGQVRTSILALLAEGPLNGYQVMQTLSERTGGAWRPSPGTVYPTLSQLEDEGLIESFDNSGQKAFRLTEAGSQAAAGVQDKPWDLINDRFGGRNPEQVKALWAEWGATAGALKEFSHTATSVQLDAATKLLAETRRKLYGMLAAGDVPNADDLR